MEISSMVPTYLEYCRDAKQLDNKTLKAYRIDLGQLAGELEEKDLRAVSAKELEAVYGAYHKTLKPKTVKRKMASGKAFFQWLEEEGHIGENPFQKVHTRFREPKVLPRTIPEHTLELFLQVLYDNRRKADTTQKRKKALRDIAAMELLFGTGIRVSELCALKQSDIDLFKGELLIYGKGRKERLVQVPDENLLGILKDYKTQYQKEMEQDPGCHFFFNDRGHPLSDQSVRRIIMKTAGAAGISQHITPHMFRHTFATSLVDNDVNIRCIQEILGHSSISTTEIYTHVSAAKQRQVLSSCHPRKHLQIEIG